MLFIAKIKTVSLAAAACLVVAGTSVVLAKQITTARTTPSPVVLAQAPSPAVPQPSVTPPASPKATVPAGRVLPDHLRGEKVLAMFWHYPEVKMPDEGPTPESDAQFVKAKQAAHDAVLKGIMESGLDLVSEVSVKNLQNRFGEYQALLLVDCKGQAPDKVLRSIPHFLTAIVFRDGQYGHGLPVQMEAQYLYLWGKKGQVPAPYAFYVRGGSAYAELQQGKADVERFQKMTELQVEARPPAGGGAGGGWTAKLTPAAGHTLLEVFLLTGAGFNLVDR